MDLSRAKRMTDEEIAEKQGQIFDAAAPSVTIRLAQAGFLGSELSLALVAARKITDGLQLWTVTEKVITTCAAEWLRDRAKLQHKLVIAQLAADTHRKAGA